MSNFNLELDASGLNCPLPIMRTKKAMLGLSSGQILKVIATDPASVQDFITYCKSTGDELISNEAIDEKYVFHIKKTS